MKTYEGMFVFPPDSGPDERKSELDAVEQSLKKFKASITEKTEWGKKAIGYPLKKHREGYFLILRFQADPAVLQDLRRVLELEVKILKFMITVFDPKSLQKTVRRQPKPSASKSIPAQAHAQAGKG